MVVDAFSSDLHQRPLLAGRSDPRRRTAIDRILASFVTQLGSGMSQLVTACCWPIGGETLPPVKPQFKMLDACME